ncbi:MAG: gluconate 2-dehydrogenase subunit 3 family protein [Bryobacteraceae bacterium]
MSYEINRRELIKIGAAVAINSPAALAVTDTPKFFTPAEFALVDELTEMIIPTDSHSPGARAAKVAAYIDQRVTEAFEPEDRENWRSGLALVDALSHKMHDRLFLEATPEQRTEVLTAMARNEVHPKTPEEKFFRILKQGTVHGYYTSSIGIHQEMEYKGNTLLQEFVGDEVK